MWGQGQGQGQGQQPNQWTNLIQGQQQPNQFGNQNQGFQPNQQPNQWGNQNQGFQPNQQGQQPNNQWGNQNQGFNHHQQGFQQGNQWGNQNQGFNPNNQIGTNPFIKPNQSWGNNGFNNLPNWINPNNFIVPPIMFNHNCKKCHGSGVMHKRGMNIPCRKCYRNAGICPACYGSGFKFINKKVCNKCQKGAFIKSMNKGKKHHGRSSSSSSGSF